MVWLLAAKTGEGGSESGAPGSSLETISSETFASGNDHSAALSNRNIHALLLPEGTTLIMEATAYTSDYESTGKKPGDPDYGITFSGLPAMRGAVAVDPDVIPLHSVLLIEGYGYAVALDTGSAIKGNRLDVYFDDPQKAKAWGRRQVEVRLISRGGVRESNGQR